MTDSTIQLVPTLAAAVAQPTQVTQSDYNGADEAFSLPGLAAEFPGATTIDATYNAPTPTTFYTREVNVTFDEQGTQSADPNTIYVAPSNLKDGDTVTYSFTGVNSPITGAD